MPNAMLSIPELAVESNESCSVWRKRIQRREIAFVKLGRNVRVKREDYLQYITARLIEPNPQTGGGEPGTLSRPANGATK